MTVSAIEGALPGAFTVNKDGDQIQFSKGNLQYQASTNTWRFAEHQWDIIGEGNANISPTYAGWIDLFGWGTSGYNNHYPYMTTTDDAAYGEARTPITDTNYDWGVYNPISNGGNKAGLWHIMDGVDKEDWYYLLKERAKANELWGTGTINGINGLILLPDDWTLPSGGHFVSTTIEYDSYNSKFEDYYKNNHFEDNKYTIDEWQIMEDAGAVFLPVAGLRKGNEYKAEADAYQENPSELIGCYWTSSVPGSWFNLHYKEKAGYSGHVLEFTKDKVIVTALIGGINWRKSDDFEHNFHFGFAVRLVKDVKETDAVIHTVTFLDWDGTELLKEKVEEGKDAKGPETDPTREGYIFTGWDKTFTNITSDLTVTAQYKEITDEIYGVLESDGKTLTLYYDKEYIKNGGKTDWAMKYYENTTKIILDESVKEARPDNLEYWFADFNKLTEIEHLDYLNTSDVTNMNSLFLNCYALTELDLSAFDTKKVESMGSMFGACTALKELNLNSLDVQKVTDAWGMFKGCTNLKTIYCNNDWSKQLPSDCDSEELFEECTSLVGGNKTAYNSDHNDASYARPDEKDQPGYFTAKSTEDINQITNDQSPMTNKVIKDAQLLIEKNGKLYNATGTEVK